jgi:hypothetical protein
MKLLLRGCSGDVKACDDFLLMRNGNWPLEGRCRRLLF